MTRQIVAMRAGVAGVVALLLISACTTNPYTGERQASKAATGAGIGAAIGAVAGVLSGDDADERRKRALIGAGVGALAGAGIGAYMDRQEAKLREELQGTGVSVTRIGDDIILNMPGNITFDVNQAAINSGFYPVLNSVSKVAKEFNQTLIDVAGHTDSTGTVAYNMDLSQRRANSVAQYLQSQGIDSTRIYAEGYGPHYPIADNSTAEGRAQNRRVEIALKPLTR
ncbi:MAG: cell envelope biogenesis protein OmpA [Gammaproteobacteria bacterium]|nr:cell envelope biogenesis protein OmpA [Gammaproteobacteria bacterium]